LIGRIVQPVEKNQVKIMLSMKQSKNDKHWELITYPTCSILFLKRLILQTVELWDISLNYNSQTLKDDKLLKDYNIEPSQTAKISIVPLLLSNTNKLNINIDFTFHTINSVRKVEWDQEAPWFWEVSDGWNWICYCLNKECKINNEMFVIQKAYEEMEDLSEVENIKCPLCRSF